MKPVDLAKLTPEEKRIRIAEIHFPDFPVYKASDVELRHHYPHNGTSGPVLDYLNDLNAMHEAEEVIGAGDLGHLHQRNLMAVSSCLLSDKWHALHATASQRADAFLLTLG